MSRNSRREGPHMAHGEALTVQQGCPAEDLEFWLHDADLQQQQAAADQVFYWELVGVPET